jgi:hypothetical protein
MNDRMFESVRSGSNFVTDSAGVSLEVRVNTDKVDEP